MPFRKTAPPLSPGMPIELQFSIFPKYGELDSSIVAKIIEFRPRHSHMLSLCRTCTALQPGKRRCISGRRRRICMPRPELDLRHVRVSGRRVPFHVGRLQPLGLVQKARSIECPRRPPDHPEASAPPMFFAERRVEHRLCPVRCSPRVPCVQTVPRTPLNTRHRIPFTHRAPRNRHGRHACPARLSPDLEWRRPRPSECQDGDPGGDQPGPAHCVRCGRWPRRQMASPTASTGPNGSTGPSATPAPRRGRSRTPRPRDVTRAAHDHDQDHRPRPPERRIEQRPEPRPPRAQRHGSGASPPRAPHA